MNTYSCHHNEDYPLEGCHATHICNHPHLEKGQRGWCIGKCGHKGIHRCGRCASVFHNKNIHTKDIYTKEEMLHIINNRIVKYEKLAHKYPSKRRQFGYKIDELISITNILSLQGKTEAS